MVFEDEVFGRSSGCEGGALIVGLSVSRVPLFITTWAAALQAPLSIGFSRQEYWSELPFPSPGDLPNPGIRPASSALQADSLPSEPPGKPIVGLVPW